MHFEHINLLLFTQTITFHAQTACQQDSLPVDSVMTLALDRPKQPLPPSGFSFSLFFPFSLFKNYTSAHLPSRSVKVYLRRT